MSYAYSEEYLAQLRASAQTQQASTAWAETNSVYETILETQPDHTMYDFLNQLPDWKESDTASYGKAYKTITFNKAGEAIGVDYVDINQKVVNPPAVIDSNISNAAYGGGGNRVFINGSADGARPNVFQKGAKILNADLRANTLASKIGWGIAAVSLGTKLGKFISQGIYDVTGAWQYNPENWKTLVDSNSPLDELDKAALRILFGLDDETGSVTPYLNSDALGAMYLTLLQSGAFNTGSIEATYTGEADVSGVPQPLPLLSGATHVIMSNSSGTTYREVYADAEYTVVNINNNGVSIIFFSRQPFRGYYERYEPTGGYYTYTGTSQYRTPDGVTYYTASTSYSSTFATSAMIYPHITMSSYSVSKIGTVIYDGTVSIESGMEGVDDDSDATDHPNPNTITGTDLATVNQQLRNNYPDLYDGEIYEDVPQPDGTTKRITYVPVPFPNTTDKTKPITGDNHQNNPTSDPDTNTEEQLKDIIQLITGVLTPKLNPNTDLPNNPVPPNTGDGNTPPTVVPAGSASSLWKIYNPTQAQVDAFGAWLWDSSFVEQIKKLFNDPMQAIIGIHKVFASPSIGGNTTIKVGYLDSQVPSAWVDNQYTTVDCGSVNLREYFGNVFDYAPYTKVQLYLPFIGIVDLDIADVMRSTISVIYHVDVLTGACLADVKVNRDGVGGVLYQYAGSAIVTYPVSAGNYMGMLAGVLSVASGIAGTILSGGALAPALIGGAVGASHLHTDVSHSGGFSGCAGAMGSKKPYLIVSRPQTAMADNYQHYTGIPANSKVTLGNCDGYAKVKSVYVNSITRATEEEKAMIEAQLKAGVLV